MIAENKPITNWQARETPEEVLEPNLPIVDPHHHLWDLRALESPTHVDFEQKVYLCEEFTNDIHDAGHNVVQTVFAQCRAFYRTDGPEHMRCVGETEFVHGIAAMSRSGLYGSPRLCTGIFSHADLRLGKAVEGVLQAHMAASKNFRGIRAQFPADLNDEFLDGYALLGHYGLSFDNYSPDYSRLPVLAKLAGKFPQVTVVVNHLGGKIDPNADTNQVSTWRECIDTIAKCPNTVMKVGGAQRSANLGLRACRHRVVTRGRRARDSAVCRRSQCIRACSKARPARRSRERRSYAASRPFRARAPCLHSGPRIRPARGHRRRRAREPTSRRPNRYHVARRDSRLGAARAHASVRTRPTTRRSRRSACSRWKPVTA